MKRTSLLWLLLLVVHISNAQHAITVIGTGYVGLVSGAGLAEFGNRVICADIDKEKIAKLQRGIIPIYEPDLDQLVHKHQKLKNLTFTTDVGKAIEASEVILIAVGTPTGHNGAADLRAVESVLKTIAQHLNGYKVICMKSTVPIGTGTTYAPLLQKLAANTQFDWVSNPEFLREGRAVNDFLEPDRIVIGAQSDNAIRIMQAIYAPLFKRGIKNLVTDITTAETIKYTANAFLATKLSFINEIANLCDATGANVQEVARGIGLDTRISKQFLQPGPGFGGSCFPKDCQALIHTAAHHGVATRVVTAALEANEMQKLKPIQKLQQHFDSLEGKTIAVLGLAFKAQTDDVRYSPAITVIEKLKELGARIKAHDPQAIENMRTIHPDIEYYHSIEEAVDHADALIVLTEWDEYKQLNLRCCKKMMRKPVIIDARNLFDPHDLQSKGVGYSTIGRGSKIIG